MVRIERDDLRGAPTRALLAIHLAGMTASSPPGQVFALDLSGLLAPEVTVWTAWEGDALLAVGALRRLGGGAVEIKSMRTHPDRLRRGAARALLSHLVATARAEGAARICLETGSGPDFEPALALYRSHGFRDGPPFAEYAANGFNRFLHLAL